MAENQSNTHNPAAFFNIYRISLTRDQQTALATLLPRGYSFQPYKSTRSLDEQSLRSESLKVSKKKKQPKDPDYAIPYTAKQKQLPPPVKVDSAQVIPGGEPFLECYLILKRLKKSIYSWPFKNPVDPKALGIPEYFNVVLEPMDLKTIEDTLRREGYAHPSEFHRDIYKILMNSYKFNQKSSDVFGTTVEFEEEYLRLVREAKEGKLDRGKRPEGEEDTPNLQKEKSVSQPLQSDPVKPRPYNKKKSEKTPQERKLEKEERVREREKEGKVKVEEIERPQPKVEAISFTQLFEGPKQQDILQFSEAIQPQRAKEQEMSISEPVKKSKENRVREKKPREKAETESLKQIKELKEVTQVQNEKNAVMNNIQRRLSDLLRRINEFQLTKPKARPKNQTEHPNFNNFSSITASEKKKLAERISMLPSPDLRCVVEICFRNKRDKKREEEGIYDIDLEKADPKTLKELSNFVAMRTKHAKRGPKARHQTRGRPPSQATPDDVLPQEEDDEDEFRYELGGASQQDEERKNQQQEVKQEDDDEVKEEEKRDIEDEGESAQHNSGVGELLLDHPGDDLHSHMLQQNFHFSVAELMQIDDDGRNSDEYHPSDDNYHF